MLSFLLFLLCQPVQAEKLNFPPSLLEGLAKVKDPALRQKVMSGFATASSVT